MQMYWNVSAALLFFGQPPSHKMSCSHERGSITCLFLWTTTISSGNCWNIFFTFLWLFVNYFATSACKVDKWYQWRLLWLNLVGSWDKGDGCWSQIRSVPQKPKISETQWVVSSDTLKELKEKPDMRLLDAMTNVHCCVLNNCVCILGVWWAGEARTNDKSWRNLNWTN